MSEKTRWPIFDGRNWSDWKFRMNLIFEERVLKAPLEPTFSTLIQNTKEESDKAILRKTERECKSLLVQCLADGMLEYIKDAPTAYDMFEILRAKFEKKGILSQTFCRKKLLALKFDDSGNLADFFLEFDSLLRQLKESGVSVPENESVSYLLLTLPSPFDPILTALETVEDEKLTLNYVKEKLLNFELKKSEPETSSCSRETTAFQTGKNNRFTCNYCHKRGHKWATCFLRQKDEKEKNKNWKRSANFSNCTCKNDSDVASESDSDTSDELAFVSETKSGHSIDSSHWILDSGASDHMSNDKSLFSTLETLKSPIKIAVAKQTESLIATHSGTLIVRNHDGRRIPMNNVLYVPNLRFNLFSIKRVEEKGMKVVFENREVKIFNRNKLVARGTRVGKLYEIQLEVLLKSSLNALSSNAGAFNQAELWHARLGHPCNQNLKKLIQHQMLHGLDLTLADVKSSFNETCEGCISGKLNQLPFPSKKKMATRPLQIIHSDVCGPITPASFDKKRYFVTFTDEYTHFVQVFTMQNKSEVYDLFVNYEAIVTSQFDQKISNLVCDNAKEYSSHQFQNFCAKQGILIQYSTPYCPQQNGVSERMNRTLMEKARCLLLNSQLDKTFWTAAIQTAAYLLNRTPTVTLDQAKTPAEYWYGKKPTVSNLKIFGCKAYAHVPKQTRGKLDSKAEVCIMLGYTKTGYKLWSMEKKKVITRRDVVFEEDSVKKHFLSDNVTQNPKEEVKLEEQDEEELSQLDEDGKLKQEKDDEPRDNESEKQEQRRSNRERRKPMRYGIDDFGVLALSALGQMISIPNTYEDAIQSPDREKWIEAMKDEINSIEENKTWDLVELPANKNLVDNKWVFTVKTDENGNVVRYKARLVAKGFSQKFGVDYEEVFAPVVKLQTLRTLLSVANHKDYHIHSMDVKTAFLNGYIQEEIYMRQPLGFIKNSSSHLVCKMNKALYGLKQAPRNWNQRLDTFLISKGFKRSAADHCLYSKITLKTTLFVIIYVDDIIMISDDLGEINEFKATLSSEFKMTDLGELQAFLGLYIHRERKEGILKINQKKYLQKILTKFDMDDCIPIKTPIEAHLNVDREIDRVETMKPYRELIGSLMYIMLGTRPDLNFSINYLSRFQGHPTDTHWSYLKRVLRYLKYTQDYELVYKRNDSDPLIGFTDSDWASDKEDRHSTSGYVFFALGNCVSWSTRKQATVALSSTEAEYAALSNGACEAIWLKEILNFFQFNFATIIIKEDNQPCIHIAKNAAEHRKIKHVDIKLHFIRELVEQQKIQIQYVASKDNKADIFTKGLPTPHFETLRKSLGILIKGGM